MRNVFAATILFAVLFCWPSALVQAKPSSNTCLEIKGECEPLYSQSYALILESFDYKNDRYWPALPSIKDDADKLEIALEDQGFQVEQLHNKSRADYLKKLTDWVDAHHGNDTRLLVFFMGMGTPIINSGIL